MNTENATVQNEVAAATPRVITVVSTRGEKVKVAYEGNTWAGLKDLLTSGRGKDVNGNSFSRFDLNNMKCVESINKHTLEHGEATIPDGNFNLFLMPYKSKSGASDRGGVLAEIKGIIASHGESAKNHFNAGKNFTNKSTDELKSLIGSYKGGVVASKPAAKAEKVVAKATKAVTQLVGAVQAKTEKAEEVMTILKEIKSMLQMVLTEIASTKTGVGMIAETSPVLETPIVLAPVKSQEEIEAEAKAAQEAEEKRVAAEKESAERAAKIAAENAAREEARRKEREEDEALRKEMAGLASGFKDVKYP